jgi:hypothetical protein
MSFIESLGTSLPTVLMFFGVLVVSPSAVVISILADY